MPRTPWIETFSGVKFPILEPAPEDIKIEDIAHALSNQCRFVGHCREFYSTAQHSVFVSDIVYYVTGSASIALVALLHDAGEAYVSDLSRPLKKIESMAAYSEIEKNLVDEIMKKFDVFSHDGKNHYLCRSGGRLPAHVKNADDAALVTEAKQLLSDSSWTDYYEIDAWPGELKFLTPKEARHLFLQRFYELQIDDVRMFKGYIDIELDE